ncbi:hypothetical protein B5566_04390 [Mycobacterium sp. MHSD3]|nr:hypothetical protein B5566_04390 [Mycobacterium sp. MHSD3]
MREDQLVPEDSTQWPSWAVDNVEIVVYDPDWAVRGARERQRLDMLLAPWRSRNVEHIGSTAVIGLAAKPIVDLQASVASLEVAEGVAAALTSHHWHYVPPHLDRRPYRRFFVKIVDGHRAAHLHLMTHNAVRWHQQLAFRDALRANRDLVRAYSELKFLLAAKHRNNREAYTAGKQKFINDVLICHMGDGHSGPEN